MICILGKQREGLLQPTRMERVWVLVDNVHMAAWRVIPVIHMIVAFLSFLKVIVGKGNGDVSKHQCVSGSQVLRVNFDQGPIPECCVMNTTPTSYKQSPTCDSRKEKEQAKNTQGKTSQQKESLLWVKISVSLIARDFQYPRGVIFVSLPVPLTIN